MPRMQILSTVEHDTFESPPVFTSTQRRHHFHFSPAVEQLALTLRTPTNQLGFLLSWGYFTATKRFFAPQTFRPPDVEYVAKRLGLSLDSVDLTTYDKQSVARHQELILRQVGFRAFDHAARTFLEQEIMGMVRAQFKPRLIFWRCVDLLTREKVEVPPYFPMADVILGAINHHKQQLTGILDQTLRPPTRRLLDDLFVQSPTLDGDPVDSQTATYKLTLLKHLSQSTKPAKIKARVSDLMAVEDLYQRLQPVLTALALPPDGIRYYANSVIKAEIFQMARRTDDDRYLHVVAFIAHQYYRLQDNLVDVLLTTVQSYQHSTQREHKEVRYAQRAQRKQLLKTILGVMDEQLVSPLRAIREITEQPQLSDTEKVAHIRVQLAHHDEQLLTSLRDEVATELSDEDYFTLLEARSVRIQNRVSPLLKALTFHGEAGAEALLAALQYLKDKDGTVDKHAPLAFLPPEERLAVTDNGRFRVSLYKAFLFLHTQRAIKAGTLNLEHSYKYRPLNEYLIDRERWQRDKTVLLERAGLQAFVDPHTVLNALDERLYQQYLTTNEHIRDGTNTFIRFGAKGTFTLKTPKQDEVEAEPLHSFFPDRHYVSLLEVLATVNRFSRFLDEFQHWQQRYHRPKPPPSTLFAGIIGLGCEIGTRKMAQISQPLNEAELEYTVNWFFSPEGTHAANDRVVQLLDRLELPNLYRRLPGQLHTSSDGQKFEVHAESLNANYSFKYFGKYQGVSVYTFLDERNLFWYSTVFSAAERESAYVLDGLMYNDVVKSDIHSTDTHGYTEAIFGATHLLGFSYAPRIKNLKRQHLYLFDTRREVDRTQWKITPSGYIDTELIIAHWDDILRLIATIKLKEVTASELFRRLNSYSKQHTLYRALKAFGRILKSLFLLRYIDEVTLRQAIERQLNKIELAHRFTRAVSVGNPREFLQAEKHEQEISEGCKRLIKNCLVCWNYLYLSQQLAEITDAEQRERFLHAVAHGSVVAWGHFNLLGEYDLSEEKLRDTVGIKLPKLLAEIGLQ
jgi:TnpA family transposase